MAPDWLRPGPRRAGAREAAGTLSGHCLGEHLEQPLTPAASLLDDLAVIFATIDTDWSWSEDMVAKLAETKPELYAGWDADTLARTLSGLGVTTRQLNRTGPDGRRANRPRRDSGGSSGSTAPGYP
jgi:S-DNA-T family DNA segregation ATPase FtsK/SpoIIIE